MRKEGASMPAMEYAEKEKVLLRTFASRNVQPKKPCGAVALPSGVWGTRECGLRMATMDRECEDMSQQVVLPSTMTCGGVDGSHRAINGHVKIKGI